MRILAAAQHLILRQGLRATTMEAVAREAKVAKPTLYGYFADKEALFAAIVEALCRDIATAFDRALHGDGDPVTRIGAALSAKYRIIGKVLEGSPHADELYSEHDRSTAALIAAMDLGIERGITETLAAAGAARPRPLAQLLLAAAYGIGRKAASPAEAGPAIRLMVERLAGPELKPPATAPERT